MAGTLNLRRGDIVTVSPPGEYGKPRPCVVVQSTLASALESITFCPMTSFIRADVPLFRITIEPNIGNGLRKPTQVAVDKIMTVHASRIGGKIGTILPEDMLRVTRALAVFLEIG